MQEELMLIVGLLTKRNKDKQLFSNMITSILKFSSQPKVLRENIIVCVYTRKECKVRCLLLYTLMKWLSLCKCYHICQETKTGNNN